MGRSKLAELPHGRTSACLQVSAIQAAKSVSTTRMSFVLKRTPLRVAYHTPCHMEKMGWTAYTLELLRQIPGLELVVLDSQCCGIAGTYGFKSENYATSQGIGASLFRQIEESGVDLVVTDCETCKWQIEMSTSKRCEHPITLLAQALA